MLRSEFVQDTGRTAETRNFSLWGVPWIKGEDRPACSVCGMGLRFQRRIRLFPGVRLNLSKSGISTSIGARGAWFTFGPRGTRTTVGLPGTGVSYTTQSPAHRHEQPPAPAPTSSPAPAVRPALVIAAVLALVLLAILSHH
jgi:hypothetical protein